MTTFLRLTTLCGCQRQVVAASAPESIRVRFDPPEMGSTPLAALETLSADDDEPSRLFKRMHGNSTESFYLEVLE